MTLSMSYSQGEGPGLINFSHNLWNTKYQGMVIPGMSVLGSFVGILAAPFKPLKSIMNLLYFLLFFRDFHLKSIEKQ